MRACPTGYISPISAYVLFRSRANFKHREPKAIPSEWAENNPAAMTDGRASAPSAYPAAFTLEPELEVVIGHEALYFSAKKCFKNVGWKWSTQNYKLHLVENVVRLADDLASGKYKEGKTHPVHLTFPKEREALAISLKDRNVQRSVNDNKLYPARTRSLIYANFACQHGKGTDAARDYWKAALHRAYLKYGTNRFKIVVVDFEDYYGSMRHDLTNALLGEGLDEWTATFVARTLDRQYKGVKGYNPGSQMVQIAGISYPNRLDHHMKEVVGVKIFMHYMDDYQMPAADDAEAMVVLAEIGSEAAKVGLRLHPEKTRIVSAAEGAVFLGFLYKVDERGKVLMFRAPKRVKEIRRRMRRLANCERRGEVRRGAVAESYRCVRACMAKGNSARLLKRMDDFINELKGEIYADDKEIHGERHAA